MAVEQEGKIKKAKIKRYDEKAMFLRQSLADGEVDGEKFDLSININGDCVIWYFHNEGRYYTVSTRDLTEEVLRFREEIGVKPKGDDK